MTRLGSFRFVSALSVLVAGAAASPPAAAKLHVVATLPDLGAIAREVGGDEVEVTTLATPSEDPHYVDPKPSFMVTLHRADLLLLNGLDLEIGWLPKLVVGCRNPRLGAGEPGWFDASTFVRPLDVPAVVDRAMGDVHPGGNPHFLFDPRAAKEVVLALGARLSKLDPSRRAGYESRARALAGRLDGLARDERARFAALPDAKRRIVTYHKSLTYLLDWLGLEEVATIEPKPGIRPSPSRAETLLGTMKAEGVRVIVQESFYPARISETLARLAGGEVVLLPAATEAGETYAAHLHRVAGLLHAALSR